MILFLLIHLFIKSLIKVEVTKEDLNFLYDKINEIDNTLPERTEQFIFINQNMMDSISIFFKEL